MNLAKISCNGQITIPSEVRSALQVQAGDKIIFLYKNDGEITIKNMNSIAVNDVLNLAGKRDYPGKAMVQAI
ncbi:MAG: AbrB/MazE/SpoVT family DNA-binding domain-containing protein [Defluviitaleaceae bacterium]|nr:AbrB/MazE/SpoVT family DNA-binding domain-containing protein [Defluviitaleaceae bacterium]